MNTIVTGIMIYQMILTGISNFQPKYPTELTVELSKSIVSSGLKHGIDPVIMYKIIAVESHFNFITINKTGDYSMTQINCRVWTKEFKRLGRELHCSRLIGDYNYSIDKMGEILSVLKRRHSNDIHWYGRYHSGTPSLKRKYLTKVKNIN